MKNIEKEIESEVLNQIDFDLLVDDGFHRLSHLDNTIVFAYLHALPSVISLLENVIKTGINPSNIYIHPKSYSLIDTTCSSLESMGIHIIGKSFDFLPGDYDGPAVDAVRKSCDLVEQVCAKALARGKKVRLILADDGGVLTEWWHRKFSHIRDLEVVSVQQTASGIGRNPAVSKIPKVNVAHSAAKRWFESKVIAGAITRRIRTLGAIRPNDQIGIVGYGPIGSAIGSYYLEQGHPVFVNDQKDTSALGPNYEKNKRSKSSILRNCDVIFGCTGRDWFSDKYLSIFDKSNIDQTYISCSSRDVEFKHLMEKRSKKRESSSLFRSVYLESSATKRVLNSGFPINFDRKREWEEIQDIVLTRSLVLIGILQAMCLPIGQIYNFPVMLSPSAQMHMVRVWLKENDYQDLLLDKFGLEPELVSNVDWWNQESGGEPANL